jgi:Helicase HerA, central domain
VKVEAFGLLSRKPTESAQQIEDFRDAKQRVINHLGPGSILECYVDLQSRAVEFHSSDDDMRLLRTELGHFLRLSANSNELTHSPQNLHAISLSDKFDVLRPLEFSLTELFRRCGQSRPRVSLAVWISRTVPDFGFFDRSLRLFTRRGAPPPAWLLERRPPFRIDVLATGRLNEIVSFAEPALGRTRLSITPIETFHDFSLDELLRAGLLMDSGSAASMMPVELIRDTDSFSLPTCSIAKSGRAADSLDDSLSIGTSSDGMDTRLKLSDLNRHILVTGFPGFGKSRTVMSIARGAWEEHGVPFLVFDPEKTEYADLLPPDAVFLCIGEARSTINPMETPVGVDPLAFASALAEMIDSATSLSERNPLAATILKNALDEMYSTLSGTEFDAPSIAQLYRFICASIQQTAPTEQTASELRTSLLPRIQSIVSGANSYGLSGGYGSGIDWASITATPAVISFSAYSDLASRRLAFGLVLAGFTAFRRANPSAALHLAVLEEAHILFPSTKDGDAGVARAIATALATQRSKGQGYILVTQSTEQLPTVVQEVCSTRLTHRVPGTSAKAFEEWAGAEGCRDAIAGLDTREFALKRASGASVEFSQSTQSETLNPTHQSRTHQGVVERIWCTQCPKPCSGMRWLQLVPEVVQKLSELRFDGLGEQAESAAVLAAQIADRLGGCGVTQSNFQSSVYCVVARTLTLLHASDHGRSREALAEASRVASEIAARRVKNA